MRRLPLLRLSVFLTSLVLFAIPSAIRAASLPLSVLQAIVWVQCDNRQGSGTVINGTDGYVLTNAHVVLQSETAAPPTDCVVGFLEKPDQAPVDFFHADVVRTAYRDTLSQDFAILKIGQPIRRQAIFAPFPFLKTNEFSSPGDAVTVLGYSGAAEQIVQTDGVIRDFADGFIRTNALIAHGDSGGAALEAQNNLIGIPTRIVTITNETGAVQSVSYELIDIRAVMTWLDSYGTNEHDKFFTHADFARYHQNAVFINQSDLGCDQIVRTLVSPTIYCLSHNGIRYGFPNEATFLTWYPNFDQTFLVSTDGLDAYTLTKNVTFKPGTLVKSATSPSVYVVVDSFGTLRWIPTEERAQTLWGPAWAALVHDIPDEFFGNYTIGQPLG